MTSYQEARPKGGACRRLPRKGSPRFLIYWALRSIQMLVSSAASVNDANRCALAEKHLFWRIQIQPRRRLQWHNLNRTSRLQDHHRIDSESEDGKTTVTTRQAPLSRGRSTTAGAHHMCHLQRTVLRDEKPIFGAACVAVDCNWLVVNALGRPGCGLGSARHVVSAREKQDWCGQLTTYWNCPA